MPRVVSQKYQSPVLSVRLIKTKRAPAVNPQSTLTLLPVPVYSPTLLTPDWIGEKVSDKGCAAIISIYIGAYCKYTASWRCIIPSIARSSTNPYLYLNDEI